MNYKKYEKELNNEELKVRKLNGYSLIKSYDVGFEGSEIELELDIEEDIYDEYKISLFSDGKIHKIKTKKIKDKNTKKVTVVATVKECGEYILYGRNANKLIIMEAIIGIM